MVIFYILSTFSGLTFHGQLDEKCENAIKFNCYDKSISEYLRHILTYTWMLGLAKKMIGLFTKIRFNKDASIGIRHSWANFQFLFSHLDYSLQWLHCICLPFLLFTDPASMTDTSSFGLCRDLSGFVLILSCFDLSFLLRDHLGDRELASMINWTEVVSMSIMKFLLIHSFILIGFFLAFYIQLHEDCDYNFDREHCKKRLMNNNSSLNEDDELETNSFTSIAVLPMKIMAMFVGELEYGDHPFVKEFAFNYIVFALFVFLVVIGKHFTLNLYQSMA